MVNGGIFGPKLSGKTTLAVALSKQYWTSQKIRSLVLDPNNDSWGQQALVFTDETKFWPIVWKAQRCLIIVEEAAETIKRSKTLIPVFTRLRHCQHKLLIIGHSGVNLLPIMREQLDTLYLFRQPEQACKYWSTVFCQKELMTAENLQQFEFLHTVLYSTPRKLKLRV